MNVTIRKNKLIVTRQKGDRKIRGGGWGSGESALLKAIQKKLNARGYDLIKKRMWKDGHMVDDTQMYLRARKRGGRKSHNIAIYDNRYAVRNSAEDFNNLGRVQLTVIRGIWK